VREKSNLYPESVQGFVGKESLEEHRSMQVNLERETDLFSL